MTKDKVRSVIAAYKEVLLTSGCESSRASLPRLKTNLIDNDALNHCLYMLDQMESFIDENRMDKVFRWLGFVQGCLWCFGVFSIAELKEHNRPEKEN